MQKDSYKVDFKDLKQRVGIDDVAYSLGYRLDRAAGVGRYIELRLDNGAQCQDCIIIANHRDKASQTFFRRNGSKGDVVTFVKENLSQFNATGRNEWQQVASVLAKFANMPAVEYPDREFTKEAKPAAVFDPKRYEVRPLKSPDNPLLKSRGLSEETVWAFAPFLTQIRDTENEKFKGYNIGFPYHKADSTLAGYEIRGMGGYKSKAAGTNSQEACWSASFGYEVPEKIYFFESAFDAMAFYQANSYNLYGQSFTLVSLGGTFSDKQLEPFVNFSQARMVECFDNDLAGRIYALRLQCLVSGNSFKFNKGEEEHTAIIDGKEYKVPVKDEYKLLQIVSQTVPFDRHIASFQPPFKFKDWNDFLLGKEMKEQEMPNKWQRDQNLAERRNKTIGI